MKSVFVTLLIILVPLANILSQDMTPAESELLQADRAWSEAAKAGDVDKIVTYWDQGAINFFPGFPPAKGIENIMGIVKANRSKQGFKLVWEAENAVVAASGDLGYTYGPFEMSFDKPGGGKVNQTGNYVCIWRKNAEDEWKCVVETSVPDSRPD